MKLAPREKAAVAVAAAALVLFAGYVAYVRPALERTETLRRVLPAAASDLEDVKAKAREIAELGERLDTLRGRARGIDRDFGLMAHLEDLQRQSGVHQRVARFNSTEAPVNEEYIERVVEMRLERTTFPEIVGFLEKLDQSDAPIRTSRLHIRRDARRDGALDATIEIRMLSLAGGTS